MPPVIVCYYPTWMDVAITMAQAFGTTLAVLAAIAWIVRKW